MTSITVPFSQPCRLGNELSNIDKAIGSGRLSGGGQFNRDCESFLSQMTGAPALLTSSCTHALEMTALLLDIGPGDEVIVPSYTFVSSASAFALRGATICFVDNDQYGNISLNAVASAIGSKTKAIVAVHYAGNSTDIEKLSSFCADRKIYLVEDAAQSIGVTYRNRALGSFGTFGCFSFHDTKNVTAGEGGALIVNDARFLERAEILRDKGTNRKKFSQGLVDKYTWVDLGSSYVLSELNAAYLLGQLEKASSINQRRLEISERYRAELQDALRQKNCRILDVPNYNSPNGHIFAILTETMPQRSSIIEFLLKHRISATFHYNTLHTSPAAKRWSTRFASQMNNAQYFTDCLVRLPLFYNMNESQIAHVIKTVKSWCYSS